MILIQLVLVVVFLLFLYRILANPRSHQLQAWTKILALLFAIVAIVTVIFPNSTNTVAHWFGVGRGADLLLYLLTLAFIFTILNAYLKEKLSQKRIVSLARKIAILEANQQNKAVKK